MHFETFEEFVKWWAEQGPNFECDIYEASVIFFHQEIYMETL